MITKTCTPFTGADPQSGASQGTDSAIQAGIRDQFQRTGRSVNAASVDQSTGEALTDTITGTPDSGRLSEASLPEVAVDKQPGQGMSPVGPIKEESPVIMPQDIKTIDGEGNMTDASEVNAQKPEARSQKPEEVAKDYQAPGPDAPYSDGPGNPSSDPLTPQVASAASSQSETVLREPTAISPEIGGRQTENEGGSIL